MNHPLKTIGLAIALGTAGAHAIAQESAKRDVATDFANMTEKQKQQMCEVIRLDTEKMTKEALPLKIDERITQVSASASYRDDTCYIDNAYTLDEDALFTYLQEALATEYEKEVPLDFVQTNFTHGEGLELVKNATRGTILEQHGDGYKFLAQVPFVEITEEVRVTGDHLPNFELTYSEQ